MDSHQWSPSQNLLLGRLKAPCVLSESQINCIVYGGDALALFFKVPLLLSNSLQVLVDKADLPAAEQAICNVLNYRRAEIDESPGFWEFPRFVPQGSNGVYAFHINEETLLFLHQGPEQATEVEPLRIYIHASTVYHVDMNNP
ncbi:hypothetical protein PM082_005914 [Marasmius tenuissimus]|nr:hypothetical protein PM082_005914 [Marasmius tenuissimus]